MTYEVTDEKEEDLSPIFTPISFPRKGKRNGAWMTYSNHNVKDGVNERYISQRIQLTPPQKTNHLY
jgi:Zn-dependent oligopeptidase